MVLCLRSLAKAVDENHRASNKRATSHHVGPKTASSSLLNTTPMVTTPWSPHPWLVIISYSTAQTAVFMPLIKASSAPPTPASHLVALLFIHFYACIGCTYILFKPSSSSTSSEFLPSPPPDESDSSHAPGASTPTPSPSCTILNSRLNKMYICHLGWFLFCIATREIIISRQGIVA